MSRLSLVEIKTILVPSDLRPESIIALRYALTLAKQFDANLTLLHVLEEPYTSDTELEPGAEELLVLKKSDEEQELALLEEELRSEYRNCRSCFRVGSPFRQIVHEAENIKASLIVISSHSYAWLERMLHGSGADIILHSTLCPVLVVKEPGTAQGSKPQETPEPR
jgi:nucleotide-binding universal stress UspA family protein